MSENREKTDISGKAVGGGFAKAVTGNIAGKAGGSLPVAGSEPLSSFSDKDKKKIKKEILPNPPVQPVSQKLKMAKSVNIKSLLEADMANIKGQLDAYAGVFEGIHGEDWSVSDISDKFLEMIKKLKYDAVAILTVNPEEEDSFDVPVAKGFHNVFPSEAVELLENSIEPEKGVVDWDKFMILAADRSNPLGQWVCTEQLRRIGYSPVHDGSRILGIIIAASYGEKNPSPVSSPLIELCGGRLGLHLGLKRKSGSSGSVLAPELSLADVKNKFRILSKYMEILRDSGSLSGEEIENLIKNCDKVLAEGINALDKLSGGGAKPA